MKIINYGRLPIKEWRGTCGVCGADVIWEQSEGVWGDDQRDGEYCHISCPTEGCTSKIYGNKEQQGMSEMPEYVLKELASKAVGEMVTALEQKARELDAAYEEIETLR